MSILVTGADGFAGRWLVRALREAGHDVVGTIRPGAAKPDGVEAHWVPLELVDQASVRALPAERYEAVVHLAGVASGREALSDPGAAWAVNAAGTARLIGELGRRRCAGEADPVVLVVSTGEVYGALPNRAAVETDQPAPCSPYAASKLGAEVAAREAAQRTGLRLVVARAFPHTGPGQDERFVIPALAQRLLAARKASARVVKVGNLEPVRDISDVRDTVAAYIALLARGVPGEVYNVASGSGVTLLEVFHRLAGIIGVDAIPEGDAALTRPADLPYLVGEAGKLRAATPWRTAIPLERTLQDVVDAQAN